MKGRPVTGGPMKKGPVGEGLVKGGPVMEGAMGGRSARRVPVREDGNSQRSDGVNPDEVLVVEGDTVGGGGARPDRDADELGGWRIAHYSIAMAVRNEVALDVAKMNRRAEDVAIR